ncbi:hypothetical protein R1flu_008198 [Riccia fluitans]|uniref:Reverse transcriptase domain-containing protein n=1 Tax=Riccia fluitans TaxID=41844 RepID=A0ABD1YB02_9MARC
MRKMGFDPAVIELTGALVSEGHAKVHLNGKFTKSFKLQSGVCQGCPVSPVLFAINIQPLTRLLRDGERNGVITRVNIPRGRSLLHRLFVDDSRVAIRADENNFNNLCKIIENFEKLSGAQLNPAKSVNILFALERPPTWLQETGCQILSPGQFITYLGFRFRLEKVEDERTNDIRNKIQGRLGKYGDQVPHLVVKSTATPACVEGAACVSLPWARPAKDQLQKSGDPLSSLPMGDKCRWSDPNGSRKMG